MADQKHPSPIPLHVKDQMREAIGRRPNSSSSSSPNDPPPRKNKNNTAPGGGRRPTAPDPPLFFRDDTNKQPGPRYKDQMRNHPGVVGPNVVGTREAADLIASGRPGEHEEHGHEPGAQRVGGRTAGAGAGAGSLVSAELVDNNVERERLEADLRPVIEHEVREKLRANIPAAVVVADNDVDRKRKRVVVTAAVTLLIVLALTAIGLGAAIPLIRNSNQGTASTTTPDAPTMATSPQPTVSPSTLAPTTRTRYSLSQVGADIVDFPSPSRTNCLATSSDCTIIAGCTRAVTLSPDQTRWNQLGAVWDYTTYAFWSVDLSGDGTFLALGASNGVQVFEQQHSTTWINVTNVLSSDRTEDFGRAVAFSSDGMFLAIGAPAIDEIQEMGRVIVYENTDGVFVRNGNVLDGSEALDHFGQNLALSADGSVLVVAAPQDMSGQRDSVQHGYVKTFQFDGNDGRYIQLARPVGGAIPGDSGSSGFGAALALSDDGSILAAGGIGNDFNVDIYNAGHVRVFNFTNNNGWVRLGDDLTGETNFAEFGTSVALSSDGLLLAVGAPGGLNAAGNETGFVRLYIYDSDNNQWSIIGNDIYGTADSDGMGEAVALSSDGSKVVAAARRYARVFEIAPL